MFNEPSASSSTSELTFLMASINPLSVITSNFALVGFIAISPKEYDCARLMSIVLENFTCTAFPLSKIKASVSPLVILTVGSTTK